MIAKTRLSFNDSNPSPGMWNIGQRIAPYHGHLARLGRTGKQGEIIIDFQGDSVIILEVPLQPLSRLILPHGVDLRREWFMDLRDPFLLEGETHPRAGFRRCLRE